MFNFLVIGFQTAYYIYRHKLRGRCISDTLDLERRIFLNQLRLEFARKRITYMERVGIDDAEQVSNIHYKLLAKKIKWLKAREDDRAEIKRLWRDFREQAENVDPWGVAVADRVAKRMKLLWESKAIF